MGNPVVVKKTHMVVEEIIVEGKRIGGIKTIKTISYAYLLKSIT